MIDEMDTEYQWRPELMVEVVLKEPDDFLKLDLNHMRQPLDM